MYKTIKCLWLIYIYIDRYVVVKWMFFFDIFVNHFPKIHRSVLRKLTIDLSYFWEVYDVNLLEKNIGRSTVYSCRTNVFI